MTFQVGDEAELGPVLMNKFLAEAAAQGAKVVLKGNKAVVVEVRQVVPDQPVESEPEPSAETAPKTAPRKKAPAQKVSRDAADTSSVSTTPDTKLRD